MKNVIILTGDVQHTNSPFAANSIYRRPYETLSQLAAKQNITLYRASYQWYDHAHKVFTRAWSFADDTWKLLHNIRPHLIFDKTPHRPQVRVILDHLKTFVPIINDLEFSTLLDNKLYTSLLLPRYSKKHYKIYNTKELLAIAKKISSNKVVLKKSHGSGGKYVEILPKEKLSTHQLTYPILVQEFIDSSSGIPGFITKPHDLRLVFIEDEFIYAYARIPAKGSDLANISQGGTILPMQRDNIPTSLRPMINDIRDIFDIFRYKVYAVDIMFDENGQPWIIELNNKPGLFFSDKQKNEQDKMFSRLVTLFQEA